MRWESHVAKWHAIKKPRSYQERVDIAVKLGYTYVSSGAGREVYLSPDKSHVVKLEYPDADFPYQNRKEYNHYKRWMKIRPAKRKQGAQFAKCKLIPGIGIFMEAVDVVEHEFAPVNGTYARRFYRKSKPKKAINLPRWVFDDETLDGWQVGYTKDNRLVVYDYGVICT